MPVWAAPNCVSRAHWVGKAMPPPAYVPPTKRPLAVAAARAASSPRGISWDCAPQRRLCLSLVWTWFINDLSTKVKSILPPSLVYRLFVN